MQINLYVENVCSCYFAKLGIKLDLHIDIEIYPSTDITIKDEFEARKVSKLPRSSANSDTALWITRSPVSPRRPTVYYVPNSLLWFRTRMPFARFCLCRLTYAVKLPRQTFNAAARSILGAVVSSARHWACAPLRPLAPPTETGSLPAPFFLP